LLRRSFGFAVLVGALFGAAPAAVGAPTTVQVHPNRETTLRSTGTTRPTRPRNVEAERVSPTKGKIRFDPARSRGSRIIKYKAYCRDTRDNANLWAWASDDESPLILRGLEPGYRYECTVRARSRAGFGPAARVTLRAHPS
jgi:Fibronectin type III domain